MPQQLSKPIKGQEAYSFGLVDAVVPSSELVDTARRWALDIADFRKPWIRSLHKNDKIEPLGEAREVLKYARTQAQKQAANLQHPLVCIDVIEEGIVSGPRAGLLMVLTILLFFCSNGINYTDLIILSTYFQEAESFQKLLASDTCKSLVHVFFSIRATTKVDIILNCIDIINQCFILV